jgi:hypothetical protein
MIIFWGAGLSSDRTEMKSETNNIASEKKGVYRKPVLTVYGDIVQLTRTSGGDFCVDNRNAPHHEKEPGLNCDGTPES